MRKIKFKEFNRDLKGWEYKHGLFHQWAQEADGEGQSNPVAIIEKEDGSVTTAYAGNCTFESPS